MSLPNEPNDQKKAWKSVETALANGSLIKPDKCLKCGDEGRLESHHYKGYGKDDYLKVKWYCNSCHKEIDASRRKKAKGDEVEKQNRVDFFSIEALLSGETEDDFMQEKFKQTDEKYLMGRAIVTNVGVFTYLRPDGKIVRELRPPEEVFDRESMKSLEMIPVTDGHPPVDVDAENIKKLQAGSAGDDIRRDDYHLSASLTITNPDTVSGIDQDGRRAISCGYTVDLEDKAGNWMGSPYDAIQRNIRYNHIAVNIDSARAGDDARIKMDEALNSNGASYSIMDEDKKNNKEVNNPMKKITIDGVEYEAEETVIKALHDAQKKVDEFEKAEEKAGKETSTLQANHDSLKDKNDQLEKDVKELKEKNPDEVKDAVQARILLLDTAKRAGIEVKDDMKDVEIMKAIIIKAFPKSDEDAEKELQKKLDEANETYINARFEAAVEYLEERGDIEEKNKEDASDNTDTSDDDEKPADAKGSRIDMIKRNQNAYKVEEK